MTFPYTDDGPIIPLEIKVKSGEWIEFHAYIDSGAGYIERAELLSRIATFGEKLLEIYQANYSRYFLFSCD